MRNAFCNDMVNIGDTFTTSHLPKKHSATIAGRLYGPYPTEIELVKQIPVNLRECDVTESRPNWDASISENDRKFCVRHTWKRTQ
jgi:uncharacterized protein (DUF111 family)